MARGPGYTLTAGEEGVSRPDQPLPRSGTETVATYPDAARITASTYGSGFPPPQTPFRPSRAFDGDPGTAWLGSTLAPDPAGMWVKVAFDHPVELSQLTVVGAPSQGSRRATAATIRILRWVVDPRRPLPSPCRGAVPEARHLVAQGARRRGHRHRLRGRGLLGDHGAGRRSRRADPAPRGLAAEGSQIP